MKNHYCEQHNLIEQLAAAESRLHVHHPQREKISTTLRRELAGIRGQRALEYPMQFLNFAKTPTVFHNLRLEDEHGFFEIDVLILSKQFILLLEAKNWYGTLLIDGMRQVIRIGDDGVEEGMPHPLHQVKIQQHRLQKWLHNHQLPDGLPIFHRVIIGYTSTILKPFSTEEPIPEEILHAHELPWEVHELQSKFPNPFVALHDLEKIVNLMKQAHTPRQADFKEQFDLQNADFQTGVICSACGALPMKWHHGKWHCTNCPHKAKAAHEQALREYQLLYGTEITNAEARRFLQIDSPNIVKKLLMEHGTPIGEKSRRKYKLQLSK